MAGARQTWKSVVIALALIVGTFVVVFIGVGIWTIRSHASAQFVDADVAQAEFNAVNARYGGRPPLIEIRAGGDASVPLVHRDETAPRREIVALHVLSYSPQARKLVRADVPGWVLKWMSVHGTIRLANLEMFDDARDRLTLEDLERHGPGIVADFSGPSHVIIWTE